MTAPAASDSPARAALPPIAVLVALNLVDELDRYAFATLAPELRDAFGLSDTGIATLRAVPGVLSLLVAVPVGVVADRTRRTRLAVAAGVVAATSSVLTGLSGALWLLVLARFGAGAGRVANEVVHPSLIIDLTPPERRPRVFALHRLANALGPLAALAAGLIASAAGWRAAFLVLAVPTALTALAALTLREPPRGRSGPVASETTTPRLLLTDPILRRVWIVALLFGTVTLQLDVFLSLSLDERWAASATLRGVGQLVFGAGVAIGIALGARLATRRPDDANALARATTIGGSPVIAGLAALALAPTGWAALAAILLVGFGFGAYQPAYFTLVATRAPAALRARAYATALFSYGIGGVLYLPIRALTPDTATTAVVLAVVMAAAAVILASAPNSPAGNEVETPTAQRGGRFSTWNTEGSS